MQKFHFSIETATGTEIVKAFENKQFHKKKPVCRTNRLLYYCDIFS